MIDERLEELASLHALGALAPEEARAFEAELRRNSELRQLVAELSAATEAVAGSVELVAPSASLREKILEQVAGEEKVVPLIQPDEEDEEERTYAAWFPWALAACFAILCGLMFLQQNSMRGRVKELSKATSQLQTVSNDLQNAVATLQVTNNNLQNTLALLQATNGDLQTALAELRENNNLANIKVTVMGALLPNEPKAVAVSLWNEKTQTGELIGQSLTPLPSDKDYQLWVIDPAYPSPVDAGVFQVDSEGKVRIQFKAKQLITTASKFAVTREVKGGSPTPKGQMVLLGS